MIEIIKKDLVCFNKDFNMFSVVPLDGYKLWSEQMNTLFKGYTLDEENVLQRVDAPAHKYSSLIDMFLAKTPSEEQIADFESKYSEY